MEIKYHVKWIKVLTVNPEVNKAVVEANALGPTIMSLVNDGKIIIQCEPI